MMTNRFYTRPSRPIIAPIFKVLLNELNNAAEQSSPKPIKKDEFKPLTNISENEHNYILEMAIPGFDKNQVEISVENNVLKVTGTRETKEYKTKYKAEYDFKSFERLFTLSNDIDTQNISAKFDNGILTISLNKKEEVKPRKIEINN
jgi:HSP20 family protein